MRQNGELRHYTASAPGGDLVDGPTAWRMLGVGRSWFYAHVAPRLVAYPVDWRVKRRRREQMRRGRPTGCGKHLYSRAEVEALRALRERMLAEADTRYVPWLLVLERLPASHRKATASSAASQ